MAKAKRFGSSKSQQGVFVDISFTGDRELHRKLNRLATRDAKRVVTSAIRNAAKPIMERARWLVPKGDTGVLARSIRLRALKRSRKRFGTQILAGGIRKTKGGGDVDAYYASFVELGTSRQKAQSFLRAAKDDGAAQFDRDVARLIGDGIEAAAKRG